MYDLDTATQFWEETGQHGSPEERVARAKTWLPYYAYAAAPLKNMPFSLLKEDDGFPAWLMRQGLVRQSDHVLDIGAGMGGDSLAFAAHCRHVTALELSGDCLEVLGNRAAQCALENITAVQGAWEEFRPEERFDVSYSSMCPAICNARELERMEEMTDRLCCLVAVMRGSYDRHRKAMMGELNIRPKGGMTTELIHYFNTLYLMGRQPNILTRTVHREYDIPAEKVLEQYPIYFRIFGVPESASLPYLQGYLSRHAQNGLLREESHIHFALLWWEPPHT